jgi:hypothetical protein
LSKEKKVLGGCGGEIEVLWLKRNNHGDGGD